MCTAVDCIYSCDQKFMYTNLGEESQGNLWFLMLFFYLFFYLYIHAH